MSVRRLLLLLILAASALVVPPLPHAAACSCAPVDVAERLPEADGAFVGRLLSRDDPEPDGASLSSASPVRYTYQVDRVVKGDIPSGTVEVWAAWMGASCGLETPEGQRAGLLLRRLDNRWISSLCEQADPDALEAVAPSSPAPPGDRSPDPPPGEGEGAMAAPTPGSDGTSGRHLLAGGAAAALVAASVAGLIRRRRLPKLPPL